MRLNVLSFTRFQQLRWDRNLVTDGPREWHKAKIPQRTAKVKSRTAATPLRVPSLFSPPNPVLHPHPLQLPSFYCFPLNCLSFLSPSSADSSCSFNPSSDPLSLHTFFSLLTADHLNLFFFSPSFRQRLWMAKKACNRCVLVPYTETSHLHAHSKRQNRNINAESRTFTEVKMCCISFPGDFLCTEQQLYPDINSIEGRITSGKQSAMLAAARKQNQQAMISRLSC